MKNIRTYYLIGAACIVAAFGLAIISAIMCFPMIIALAIGIFGALSICAGNAIKNYISKK